MIKYSTRNFCFCLLVLIWSFQFAGAQTKAAETDKTALAKSSVERSAKEKAAAIAKTQRIIAEVIDNSYPELRGAKVSVKTFRSSSDYFRSQFSVSRFLTFRRLHYIVLVNPEVFSKAAPADGIRAIIAHELAHAAYYKRHNRFELLGLVGLESKSFTARFERGADLQAIKRGYGAGLKSYRQWLYQNIPPAKIKAKKRDYFSPEEIDLILAAMKKNPGVIDDLIKKVPRNLTGIETAVKDEKSPRKD